MQIVETKSDIENLDDIARAIQFVILDDEFFKENKRIAQMSVDELIDEFADI